MQTFADAGISVDVTFQLLAESGLIKVVSSPRMTVAVGQTGYMLAGQELPIQSTTIAANATTTATTAGAVGGVAGCASVDASGPGVGSTTVGRI